jgi:hypothetical protein
MPNEIIAQIKAEYSKMSYLISGRSIERGANTILDLLHELSNDTEYKEVATRAKMELSHTIGKEVDEAIEAHNAMTKRNAAKIRKQEYQQCATTAIDQIHLDIFMVLQSQEENEKK